MDSFIGLLHDGESLVETGEKSQPHLSLGSLVHLNLGLARRDTWFTAAWAAMCGAVASGGLAWRLETAVTLVLTLFLADPLMGAVCSALRDLPSPVVRSKARGSNPGYPGVDALPAPRFGPLGASLRRLRRALRYAVAWCLALLRPPVLPALVGVGIGGLAALMIALLLGTSTTLIVSLGLGLVLLRFILFGRRSVESPWQRALLEVGLVWLLGFSALYDAQMFPQGGFYRVSQAWQWRLWERYGWEPLAVAALYAVAYGTWLALQGWRRLGGKLWLLNVAQVVAVGLLVALHRPLLAAVAALLLLGQMLFQPWLRAGQTLLWYRRATQFLLMANLLVTSLALVQV